MEGFQKILTFALLFLQLGIFANAACDICQRDSQVACHNETVFSLCVFGVPTYDFISCPDGNVCNSNPFVCSERSMAVSSCARAELMPRPPNLCRICNEPSNVFACINSTTIAFCFGTSTPKLYALAHCPPNTYCHLNNSDNFCTEMDPALASCPNLTENIPIDTTTAPSTTPKPRTPDEICDGAQAGHLLPYDNDTNCAGYIVCNPIEGAIELKCRMGQYFDKDLKYCVSNKPAYCI